MKNTRVQIILGGAFGLAVTILFLALIACTRGPAEQSATGAATTPDAEASPPPEPFDLGPVVPGTAPENPYSDAQIERGEYLVRFGSCNDCHTPWNFDPVIGAPRPDMSRMLSGHPSGAPDPQGTIGPGDIALIGPTFTSFALPFGTMYSLNLTPDIETGTGSWTEEMFLDIFRTGRHLGGAGRGVLPPMPWLWIRNLTDEDLISIFAYLRSIPPIHNLAPEPAVPEEAIWQIRDADEVLAIELPQADCLGSRGRRNVALVSRVYKLIEDFGRGSERSRFRGHQVKPHRGSSYSASVRVVSFGRGCARFGERSLPSDPTAGRA